MQYPGRFPLVHVKDLKTLPHITAGGAQNYGDTVDLTEVGSGMIDWKRIFAQSEKAGIKHYIVEHDHPKQPFDSITKSYEYLTRSAGRLMVSLPPLRGSHVIGRIELGRFMQVKRTPKTYDVCIIGSGASGGTAAKVLTEGGLSVALLEAGPPLVPAARLQRARLALRSAASRRRRRRPGAAGTRRRIPRAQRRVGN